MSGRWRSFGRPIAAAGFALALAGCGNPFASSGSPPPGTPFAVVDACGLVPDMDDVLFRTALAAPSAVTIAPNERCTWVYGSNPSRDVSLTVGPAANHGATIDAFGAGETIEGVGDDARWWHGNRVLSVVVGGRSIQVDLRLEPEASTRELALLIASEAVPRLR